MTVPFPLDAFDHAKPVRPSQRPPVDRGRIVSIGLTVAFHVAVVAALLTAVHVAPARMMRELSVTITPDKPAPRAEQAAPAPKMVTPAMVTAPMPEVVIQQSAPPPVTAAPPQPKAVAPAPAMPMVASPVAGQGRDAYLGRLLAHLNQYKHYPRAARQAHIEGVAMVHFVMDGQGKVLNAELAKSSGRPVLDDEALALMARAQPLPALPADYPTRTLDAVVPIEFYLNR